MLKALIIEDEVPAQINLKRALAQNIDDVEVTGTVGSVTGAVEWLSNAANKVDMIFMDVQLSDGMCFEIFKHVDIKAKVIITTAYDNYAIKAFKVNSIDYLLKPIDTAELIEAVARCRNSALPAPEAAVIESALTSHHSYKQRFAVKVGDRIVIVPTAEVAYFCSEQKTTYIVTSLGKRYIMDLSLDNITPSLDPDNFFRLSRNCIASIGSIKSVSKHLGSRLKVVLTPHSTEEIFVSRTRIGEFMRWLGGE